MNIRPMDPEVIKKLLETEEDVLRPTTSHNGAACPSCGGALLSALDVEAKRLMLSCPTCGFSVEPQTGIIAALGHPERTKETVVQMITPASGQRGDR
jgi:predicted RNA-binding Zn-ribbon protein involved in translation (DUF1610 family)